MLKETKSLVFQATKVRKKIHRILLSKGQLLWKKMMRKIACFLIQASIYSLRRRESKFCLNFLQNNFQWQCIHLLYITKFIGFLCFFIEYSFSVERVEATAEEIAKKEKLLPLRKANRYVESLRGHKEQNARKRNLQSVEFYYVSFGNFLSRNCQSYQKSNQELDWLSFPQLYDWSTKLALVPQPIRCKTKTLVTWPLTLSRASSQWNELTLFLDRPLLFLSLF